MSLCMSCGVHSLLVGYCSLHCAHQEVEKRAAREKTTIDNLAAEIFKLTEQLRRLRQQGIEGLRQQGMVLG